MKRIGILTAALTLIIACALSVGAANIYWTNITAGYWNNPLNWSPVRLPASTDDVFINSAYNPIVMFNAGDYTVHSINCAELFFMQGGSLVMSGNSMFSAGLNFSGGYLTPNGVTTMLGAGTWTGGEIYGVGYLSNEGVWSIGDGNPKALWGVLYNTGIINHNSTYDISGGTLNNNSPATYDIKNDTGITCLYGFGVVYNRSTFWKSAGTGVSEIRTFFNNYGNTYVQSGTLLLSGGGNIDNGTFSVSTGCNLDLASATLRNYGSSSIGGGGSATRTGGTLELAGSSTLTCDLAGGFKIQGGTITGLGQFYNYGAWDWYAGSLVNAGAVENDGTMTVTGSTAKNIQASIFGNKGTITHTGTGSMQFSGASHFHNLPGAVYDFQSDARFLDAERTSTVHNSGTIRKSHSTGLTIIEPYLDNRKTLEVQSGTLMLRGGGQFVDTTTDIWGSSYLNLESGTYTVYGDCHNGGGGYANLTGGTINLADYSTLDFDLDGGLLLAGTNISGYANLITKNNSNYSAGTISGDCHFGNEGWMTISGSNEKLFDYAEFYNTKEVYHSGSGSIRLGPNSSMANLANSIYSFWSDAGILGAGKIDHSGTLRKDYSSGTTLIEPVFNNTYGYIDARTGKLKFTGGGYWRNGGANVGPDNGLEIAGGNYTLEGMYETTGGGSAIYSGGTFNLLPGAQMKFGLERKLKLTGATFTGLGALINSWNWDWSGGKLSVPVTNSGALTLSGTATKQLHAGKFYNPGTITQTGTGPLEFKLGSNLDNAGTYEFQADASITSLDSGNVINNAGTFRKDWTTGISTIQPAFNNSGLIEVRAGTLRLAGGGTFYESGASITAPYKLEFTGGTFSMNGEFIASGEGSATLSTNMAFSPGGRAKFNTPLGFHFTGGTVSGQGAIYSTINGDWSGGTIAEDAILVNQGTFSVMGSGAKYLKHARLTTESDLHHTGTGALDVDANSSITVTSRGSYFIQSDGSITGAGKFNNTGLFSKTAGSEFVIEPEFNNTGTVEVKSGALILRGPLTQLVEGTLTGGIWAVNPRCVLIMGREMQILQNNADVTLTGDADFPALDSLLTNNGTLRLQQGCPFTAAGQFTNAGILDMDGSEFVSGKTLNTGTWTGAGAIAGGLTNRGLLNPTYYWGEFRITNNYSQSSTGTLRVTLGGTRSGQFTYLNVGGNASLNGTLDIIRNGYTPKRGDMFRIIGSKTRTGKFAAITGADLGNGLWLNPMYTSTGVVLLVGDYQPAATDLATVAAVRSAEPGAWVNVPGVVSAAFSDGFFIQDANRAAGIRVEGLQAPPSVGQRVYVTGKIQPYTPCVTLQTAQWVPDMGVALQVPKPLYITGKSLGGGTLGLQQGVRNGVGLNNVGLLVRVTGKVTYLLANQYAYIDDGSGLTDGNTLGPNGTAVKGLKITLGANANISPLAKWATVTGISYRVNIRDVWQRTLIARSQEDIRCE